MTFMLRLAALALADLLTAQRPRTIYEVGMSDAELDRQPDDYREAERVGRLMDDYNQPTTTAGRREEMLDEHPELEGLVHRPVNVLHAYDNYEPPADKAQRAQEVENARRQALSIKSQLLSGSMNVDADTKEVFEELLIDAELPDELGGDIAALQLVNLKEAAEAAHRAAEPFGHAMQRQETPLADGSVEVREVDPFRRERTTIYSASEVAELEAEAKTSAQQSAQPWGGDEEARNVSLEQFNSWSHEQQVNFLERHPDIGEGLVRMAEGSTQ